MPGARTLTERIISTHVAAGPEEELALTVDQILLEDATGTTACLQVERLGLDRVAVPLVLSRVDHTVLAHDDTNPDGHAYPLSPRPRAIVLAGGLVASARA